MTSVARNTLVLIAVAATATVVATAAPAATSGGSAKAWCAGVIQVNTRFGAMKNKTFLQSQWVKVSVRKAIIDWSLKNKSRILAATPTKLKSAQTHELVWFAHMKAANYAYLKTFAPMTAAEAMLISNFERTTCGIRFA